ncbi:MAG TPA: efflux RND transporter permease subunit, partial [Planctomycetota bacterium]|nr:efflux RND transporter permease subunit [Planctomycetota bacterium]
MIERLIDLCIRHRAIVLLLTAFLVAGGIWSARNIAVDALPDLSDVQVIIRTEYPGQAPQIVEDQVTYPLTTAMLSVPHAKVVRGYSMFGTSFVYVIFEDGTDMYWARSRVLEQLSFVGGKLPPGVSPELGPDATGVGWVFEYVLVTGQWCPSHPQGAWHDPKEDRWYERPSDAPNEGARERLVHHRIFSEPRKAWHDPVDNRRYDELELIPTQARDRVRDVELTRGVERCPIDGSPLLRSDLDLSDLRGLQDWYLRYELTALEGVSEVAALGGFVKQYQIVVDPVELRAYGISLREVEEAIARSNLDAGGRLIEMSETELMVRGLGYLGTLSPSELEAARAEGRVEEIRTERVLDELKTVALGANEDGSPIWLTDVAQIRVGPEIRRGVAEWNGEGEVAGGIVVMRYGENARETIARVRDRLAELERGLPPGVAIEVAYDRSDLIDRAIATLSNTLIEEMTVVSLILLLFLLHARSTLVAIFVLPTGVLASLVIMHLLGINANIMSLGGIAIAIGVMVDSAVIMVENAHKHLEAEAERVRLGFAPRRRSEVVAEAAREVGPSLFFSLLVITVSFLPVFVLGEQSGRLFKPLAFTKTFAMGAAAILAVTVVPVLMVYFISERVVPRTQSRTRAALLFAAIAAGPAILLAFMPLPQLEDARWWLVGGWVVLVSAILLPQR